jgi:hypothetical protein
MTMAVLHMKGTSTIAYTGADAERFCAWQGLPLHAGPGETAVAFGTAEAHAEWEAHKERMAAPVEVGS